MAADTVGVPRRLRTRTELLGGWRAEAEAAAAARDAAAEAAAAAALDAADPLLSGAPITPEAVVRVWAADGLGAELHPADPVPLAILAAFRAAQAALWVGEPISDPTVLVDEPVAGPPTDP